MFRSTALLAALLVSDIATAQLTCTSTLSGTSCGPTLDITFVLQPNGPGNYDFTMTANGLHPHSLGGFIWGANPVNIPLPFGCTLLTDYVWGHLYQTDNAGSASWSRSWPHWATITFYMQMASVTIDANGFVDGILTTDCKLAGCL
jgi:hypothetical protein